MSTKQEFAIYIVVFLGKATPHPLFPKSDDEEAKEKDKDKEPEEEESEKKETADSDDQEDEVIIDLDGLQNRIIALIFRNAAT